MHCPYHRSNGCRLWISNEFSPVVQYECPPDSIYYYWKGVNWHTFVVWIFGVGPTIPGFPHQSVRAKITAPSVPWKFIIFAVLLVSPSLAWPTLCSTKSSRSLASVKSMMMTSLAPPLRKKLNPRRKGCRRGGNNSSHWNEELDEQGPEANFRCCEPVVQLASYSALLDVSSLQVAFDFGSCLGVQ